MFVRCLPLVFSYLVGPARKLGLAIHTHSCWTGSAHSALLLLQTEPVRMRSIINWHRKIVAALTDLPVQCVHVHSLHKVYGYVRSSYMRDGFILGNQQMEPACLGVRFTQLHRQNRSSSFKVGRRLAAFRGANRFLAISRLR